VSIEASAKICKYPFKIGKCRAAFTRLHAPSFLYTWFSALRKQAVPFLEDVSNEHLNSADSEKTEVALNFEGPHLQSVHTFQQWVSYYNMTPKNTVIHNRI